MDPRSTDLILEGKRVHAWIGGQGPALLLIHSAWGDASFSWSRVWQELAESFLVLAPDLPGFGTSAPLDRPTLKAFAEVLQDLLDSQKTEKAIVAGNSFGVAVAVEFASLFPERTKQLMLVNGGYVPALPWFLRSLMTCPILEGPFRSFFRSVGYADTTLAKAFPDHTNLPAGFFDQIRRDKEQKARVVFDTVVHQRDRQSPPRVPVALLWGTGDHLLTRKQQTAFRASLTNALFVPLSGAGHMPQVEQPQGFIAALRNAALG